MKKCLIMAAALVLVATSAMATSVVGSAHDMNQYANTNNSAEVCVFCHTPHAANTDVSKAPLWNRGAKFTALADLYNSATLNDASRPTTVSSSIANSDAPLCLSCHDGAAVTDGLFNEPQAGAITWDTPGVYTWTNAEANLTSDLSNDHPIGMVYDTVATTGDDVGGFVAFATVDAKLDFFDGGKMWCSTCHDVHSNDYTPFLATSNAASALCIACHNK